MKIDLSQITVFPLELCFWEYIEPSAGALQQTQALPVPYAEALRLLREHSRSHVTLSPTGGTTAERLEELKIRFETDGVSVDIFD